MLLTQKQKYYFQARIHKIFRQLDESEFGKAAKASSEMNDGYFVQFWNHQEIGHNTELTYSDHAIQFFNIARECILAKQKKLKVDECFNPDIQSALHQIKELEAESVQMEKDLNPGNKLDEKLLAEIKELKEMVTKLVANNKVVENPKPEPEKKFIRFNFSTP